MPTRTGRPLLAGDHTLWPRPDAVTLQERTIEHTSVRVPGNKPIGIGEGYSTIAWVRDDSGSWALPLRHERITRSGKPYRQGNLAAKTSVRAFTYQTDFSLG